LIAQNSSWCDRLYLDAGYQYGFLMPHRDYISFFVKEHIQGFQVNAGLFTNGRKSWHKSYNYPQLGVGYHYSGLANPDVYGHLNAVYGYVDRYYLNRKHRFNFGNKLSLGGAYINKKFDLETNGTNLAIGSRLNAYVNYSFETTFRVAPLIDFKLGGGITHVSNGSFKQPNKGLNFLTAFSGFSYSFNKNMSIEPLALQEDSSKHQFLIMASLGYKQISRKYENSYMVEGISGEYAHLITGNSWGGAAITFYYDPSLKKEIWIDDTITSKFKDNIRVALNLSYELKMGRISYVFQPGVYLKNSYKKPGGISNRLSVRYQLSNKLSASFTIKAHWFAVADFFEWGIGYRWKK
jgi:hypothetical protein